MRKLVLNMADTRTRWAITPEAVARLRTSLPAGWQLLNLSAPASSLGDGAGCSPEAIAAVRDAEIYAGFGFPRELFFAAAGADSRLRWVHSGAAGVGALLYPEMIASDIVVTNSAGIHAPPMAETVIAMMLHFARGFDFAVRNQARAAWDHSAFDSTGSPVAELAGLTLGILGYGGIGREVARRAHALGMRVIAVRRRFAPPADAVEVLAGDAASIERIVRESDFLLVAMPSTPATRGLIGARELGWMKPGAVLVNVARGNIVDEQALVAALEAGALRGAALDVFEHEPLPADSPLWRLPNTLILPHISATTTRYWEREVDLIVDNFQRYLQGQPLRNTVDKKEGY